METLEPSYISSGNVKWYVYFEKKNLKKTSTYWYETIPNAVHNSSENKEHIIVDAVCLWECLLGGQKTGVIWKTRVVLKR